MKYLYTKTAPLGKTATPTYTTAQRWVREACQHYPYIRTRDCTYCLSSVSQHTVHLNHCIHLLETDADYLRKAEWVRLNKFHHILKAPQLLQRLLLSGDI